MKCFFAISLSVLAALALSTDAASIHDKTTEVLATRTSEGATLATSTSGGSTSGPLVADELTRTKRTLGVDKNVKKEYEIKTKHGTTIKVSKSITYNDGGGLTMAPALIDSIGANRRKLIYALRGYKYCDNGCVSNASSDENESPDDENIGGNSEVSVPGGEIGGLGGASSGAAAEAWGQTQAIGGSEGSAVSGSQASAQASSHAEGSAAASSQASAQASSQAEGSAAASSQASAQASSQAEGSASSSSQVSAQASSQTEGSVNATSQASAQASIQVPDGQIGVSGGCEGYGCEVIVDGVSNPAPAQEIAQGGDWEGGSQVVVGGESGWEGAQTVGGWPNGCTGDYGGFGSNGCICSQMMPVLLTPANSYGQFRSHHLLHASPFSHVIKRHIRTKIRSSLLNRYSTNSLCYNPYNPCCTPYRK